MARIATRQPSNNRLEEALATLITNQAHFVAQMARMDERFAKIETELTEIKSILLHHQRTLDALPEAIAKRSDSGSRDSLQR